MVFLTFCIETLHKHKLCMRVVQLWFADSEKKKTKNTVLNVVGISFEKK